MNDFDAILKSVVPCRKLRWICRKHLNDVARQVEIPGHVLSEVTLHHYYTAKDAFSV